MVLTFTTGVIDAISFVGLGHVFTANMTGNVVFIGFALAGAEGVSIARSLVALGSFAAGAGLGGRLVSLVALTPMTAMAMGMRNAIVRKLGVPDVTTTVLTLTVTGLAADSSVAGGDHVRRGRRVLSAVAMLGGAFSGTLFLREWGFSAALALAAFLAGAVAVLTGYIPSAFSML